MKKTITVLALMAAIGVFAQGRSLTRPGSNGARTVAPRVAPESSDTKEAPALNWDAAPVDAVLQAYAEQLGKTVLKDPGTPNATITLKSREGQKLTQREYLEAIEVILEMNGVHIEPYGERFIRAIPRPKVRKDGIPLYMDVANVPKDMEDGKVVSVRLKFNNIGTDEAQKTLEGFKSDAGLLQVFERTNTILVTDTWLNIKRMIEIAQSVDIATPVLENVFVRQIEHASAADIKQALEQIVQESQKELEKNKGANNQTAQPAQRPQFLSGGNRLLRPGQNNQPPPQTVNESLVMSVSDADRGMIRGKVLILADERSNKLVIVTQKPNMDFFDKVIEQLDVETTPDIVVKVYRLKYADSEEVSDMINDLIGNSSKSSNSKGNQNANARNGTGGNMTRNTTTGSPATRTQSGKSSNQRSGDAKAGELTKDNTTVLSDKRINGLVVMTEKSLVPTIEQIIESMDVKLSQVLIETVIVEVSLGDDLQTGIDWVRNGRASVTSEDAFGNELGQVRRTITKDDGSESVELINMFKPKGYKSTYTSKTGATIVDEVLADAATALVPGLGKGTFWNGDQNFASAMSGGASPAGVVNLVSGLAGISTNLVGGGLNYVFQSDALNLSAIIKASKTDSRAKYLASPIVMTVDNKEATIDATETRKFFGGYETSSSYSTYMRTPKYDSKDIGIKIKVKPKINPNGTVMLNVEEEYSQLGAGQSILVGDGAGKENIDTSLTRKMTADALLENMQTVVLCGLTETYTAESENGIPLLKDIPFIGKWLFGSVSQTESRKELLIFMTPYVLDDGESAQAEALRRKNALSDPRPWDDHSWSKSKLADPVSKKEQLRRLKDEWNSQDEERKTRIAIENEKIKRIKHLEELDASEREIWLKRHLKELEGDEQDRFEAKMDDPAQQEELRKLAAELRKKKLLEAEMAQKKALDNQDRAVAEGKEAEKAAEDAKPVKEAVEPAGRNDQPVGNVLGALDEASAIETKPAAEGN